MSLQRFPVFEFKQNENTFLSLVLPLSVLMKVSKVLVYGDDADGYQRKPNSPHYNKIKKYITTTSDFMLPTSVILGADYKETMGRIKLEKNGVKYLSIDDEKDIFRIVDGQHRITGLQLAIKERPDVATFPLNVIIILSDESNRSKELQIFTDINSKSKRINIDLAELAKHDYQIKENKIVEKDINRHIAIKTAFYLKDSKGSNVWQNAIKFEIHSEVALGIIGVTIFAESIKSIIDKYILDNSYKNQNGQTLSGQDLIKYCQIASQTIGAFLLEAWNDVIKTKWPGVFKEDFVRNDEGDLVKIYYSKDFYVQKGLGIKSLNPIIGEIVKTHGVNASALTPLKHIVFESKVRIDDWKNGGTFSGFNSESGFSKIRQMILNEISIPAQFDPNQINLF